MTKEKLVEIKKGQVGTGLLIENDGYVSLDVKDNRKLLESTLNDEGSAMELPRPFIVNAIFQKYGVENANGRIYPEDILKREVEKYKRAIAERRAIGESDHPESATVSLERVSMNIVELHWEGRTLVGKLEIPITEGFRKYGIISCLADQTAHLILSGIRIGVSSRALGTVKQIGGVLMVNDDLELVCWDFVSCPSTPGAYVSANEGELDQFKEEKKNDDSKLINEDKFSKFDAWLLK